MLAAPTFSTGDVPTATQVNSWFTNVTFVRKTATESVTSSTSLQDDDVLTLTPDANTVYELSGQIIYDGATGGDLKIGWTLPASSTFNYWASGVYTTAALYIDDQAFWDDGSATPTFGGLGAGTTAAIALGGLLVMAGTSAAFTFRWAQGTSSGTATRVFAGSYLSLRRMS